MLQYGREKARRGQVCAVALGSGSSFHKINIDLFLLLSHDHQAPRAQQFYSSLKTKLQAHRPPGGMLQPEHTLKLNSGNIEPFHGFTRGTRVFVLFF